MTIISLNDLNNPERFLKKTRKKEKSNGCFNENGSIIWYLNGKFMDFFSPSINSSNKNIQSTSSLLKMKK